MQIEVKNAFGPDGARRSYSASVSYSKSNEFRSRLAIEADNDLFALLDDLQEGVRPDAAEAILLEALAIGLDYMWRRDSGCECLCAEADAEEDLISSFG